MTEGQKLKQWLYDNFWNGRARISEISGEFLGWTFSNVYYHHILPKRNYKDLIYVKENIIILTQKEHEKVENDSTFFPEINQRREKLLLKYGT